MGKCTTCGGYTSIGDPLDIPGNVCACNAPGTVYQEQPTIEGTQGSIIYGVTSVNGKTGQVVITTSDISEGSNLYYTDIRARQAISGLAPISYSPLSGQIAHNQSGVIDGTYGNDSQYPVITVDKWGHITGASLKPLPNIAPNPNITAIQNLTGTGYLIRTGTNTWDLKNILGTSGRISVINGDGVVSSTRIDLELVTSVTPGVYGDNVTIPVVTVDAYGRVINITQKPIQITLPTPPAQTLGSLTNVNASADSPPSIGLALVWDGTQWSPSSAPGIVVENGLMIDGNDGKLKMGGALTRDTDITTSAYYWLLTSTNSGIGLTNSRGILASGSANAIQDTSTVSGQISGNTQMQYTLSPIAATFIATITTNLIRVQSSLSGFDVSSALSGAEDYSPIFQVVADGTDPKQIQFPTYPSARNDSDIAVNYLSTDSTGKLISKPLSGLASGSVTTISVVTANGFAGTIANPTTTPAITIKTTITGILKGNGTAISAAIAGTDYLTPSDNYWTKSGNDIQNNNTGAVTIDTEVFTIINSEYTTNFFTVNGTSRTVQFGDTTFSNNHTNLSLNDNSRFFTLNAPNGTLVLGDGNALGNNTVLYIDDSMSSIYGFSNSYILNSTSGGFAMLSVQYAAGIVIGIGDVDAHGNNTGLFINDATQIISIDSDTISFGPTSGSYINSPLMLIYSTGQIFIGDINNRVNGTVISISDATQEIQINTLGFIMGSNLYTSGLIAMSGDSTGVVYLGDAGSDVNGTSIVINDSTTSIRFNNAYTFPVGHGTAGQLLMDDGGGNLSWSSSGGGSGTVTTVSVASTNGFAGTVATATSTPIITISTTITGLLKGNGTAISAATAGTDYLSILSGDVTTAGNIATLATVNTAPGSYGSASNTVQFTANGKGLITAIANVSIQITESQVTNLTTDLAGRVKVNGTTPLTANWNAGAFSIASTQTAATANSVVDGFILSNTTTASATNQMYSPAIHFTGQGWKAAATASSQSVDIKNYLVPVQAANIPTGILNWDMSANGQAYKTVLSLSTTMDTSDTIMVANLDIITVANKSTRMGGVNNSGFFAGWMTNGNGVVPFGTFAGNYISQWTNNGITVATATGSTGRVQFGSITITGASASDIPSAQVSIVSTTTGFLVPQMTTAQMTAISSPADGLIVGTNDSVKGTHVYDTDSSKWRRLITAKYTKVTANYTVLPNDYVISVNNIAVNVTITLPATAENGKIYIIKRFDITSTGSITINCGGSTKVQDINLLSQTSVTLAGGGNPGQNMQFAFNESDSLYEILIT